MLNAYKLYAFNTQVNRHFKKKTLFEKMNR